MTITNPLSSPQSFARAYGEQFRDAVSDAAGRDGRLSQAEAKDITETWGPERSFAQPIESYFEMTGQRTVSVDKLTGIATRRAEREAEAAGSSQGRVRGRALPGDLAQVYLRFERNIPARAGDLSQNELQSKADDFIKNTLAPARGWTDNLEVYDTHDATSEWFGGLKYGLARRMENTEVEDLVKIDYDLGWGDPDLGAGKSVGVALDRRTGEVLEFYVGREGAATLDDL